MILNFPSDGFVFLERLFFTPIPYVLAIVLMGLSGVARRESDPVFYRPHVEFPLWTLPVAVPGWFVLETALPHYGNQVAGEGMLLLRNLGTVLLIFLPLLWRDPNVRFKRFVGRYRPVARLVLLGAGTWVGLGFSLWLFSFVIPFRLQLPSVPVSWFEGTVHLLGVVVLIPLTEELLFRGYLYPLLRPRVGIIAGIAGSSALFAFLHGPMSTLPFLFVGGVGMCALYEASGSILPGWCLHIGFNGLVHGGAWILN